MGLYHPNKRTIATIHPFKLHYIHEKIMPCIHKAIELIKKLGILPHILHIANLGCIKYSVLDQSTRAFFESTIGSGACAINRFQLILLG